MSVCRRYSRGFRKLEHTQNSENLPVLPCDGGYFPHAQYLGFHHPITGEQINLEASGFALPQ